MRIQKRLNTEKWSTTIELYQACLDVADPEEKKLLLQTEKDPEVLQEVQALLNESDESDSFLNVPILSVLTQQIVDKTAKSLPFSVGKYTFIELLGKGGMAEVFLARTTGPGGFEKLLAVKRVYSPLMKEPEFKRLFEYEAQLYCQLSHPNIVQVYDFEEVDNQYLLVMEYIRGKNLTELLEKLKEVNYPLPLPVSLYIMREVARGMEYAHLAKDENSGKPLNIVHRDLTPANIMLSYNGRVRVVDFGIAEAVGRCKELGYPELGTASYLSPEAIQGKTCDPRSDVFVMGALLYELLTGEILFQGERATILNEINNCENVIEKVLRLNVDSKLKLILCRSLAKDPKDRFAHAGEFMSALRRSSFEHESEIHAKELSLLLKELFSTDIKEQHQKLRLSSMSQTQKNGSSNNKKWRGWHKLGIFAAISIGILGWVPHKRRVAHYLWNHSAKIVALADPKTKLSTANCSLEIQSKPSRANVFIMARLVGFTPLAVGVPCGSEVDLALSQLGYQRQTKRIQVTQKRMKLALELK